jgi:hypothetical protein
LGIAGANELVAVHRDGNFKRCAVRDGSVGSRLAPEYFAETANPDWWIISGQSNQVFDLTAHFNRGRGEKANAGGTDIPRFLDAVDWLITQLDDLQRKLQSIPLCLSLVQSLL